MWGVENITPKVVLLGGTGFMGIFMAFALMGSLIEAVANREVPAVYLAVAFVAGCCIRFFAFLLKKAGEEFEDAWGRR